MPTLCIDVYRDGTPSLLYKETEHNKRTLIITASIATLCFIDRHTPGKGCTIILYLFLMASKQS